VHGASLTLVSKSLRRRDTDVSEQEQHVGSYQREAIVKKLIALAALLVLGGALGVILASRGSDHASPPPNTDSNPYSSPIKTKGSSPARLMGDGRYFGYVRSVDGKSQPPTISFDVAQFYFGKNGQKAAEEDGAVAPGEAVPNDHYERNPNTRASALTVANDASVTAASPVSRLIPYGKVQARCRSACADGTVPASLAEFFAAFEKTSDGMTAAGDPVWVTIRDGRVVRIDEQYFP
jgi:hypothetical protein